MKSIAFLAALAIATRADAGMVVANWQGVGAECYSTENGAAEGEPVYMSVYLDHDGGSLVNQTWGADDFHHIEISAAASSYWLNSPDPPTGLGDTAIGGFSTDGIGLLISVPTSWSRNNSPNASDPGGGPPYDSQAGWFIGPDDGSGLHVLSVSTGGGVLVCSSMSPTSLDGWSIRAIDEPDPPLVGDFNGNGDWDAGDIDILRAHFDARPEPPYTSLLDIFPPGRPDGVVNRRDYLEWFGNLTHTNSGDANVDGIFNSADFIQVLAAGEYEDDIPLNSTWGEGDWFHDYDFTTVDIIDALQNSYYSPFGAVAAVPEPSCLVLVLWPLLLARKTV